MSSRVFTPKASIQRVKKPTERIYALSSTPTRVIRSPSPALRGPPGHAKKPGPTPCKNCGSTETEEGDGNIVCKGCGLVLSNAPNYTSDITFEEGSNGRIQQQGQRVAEGQTHQKAFAPRGLGGGPGHEATPAGDKAKTEATGVIRRYAMLLRIDEREVNIGRRIFEMAYNRGFVRGRTIESVAIVSLYIATRRAKDRKPLYDIMLIDLAEQANTNVFDLGKMMQDLIKKLYLNPDGTMSKDDHFFLQAHGAEVLIDKFVNHLDFGPDSNKIKNDATRILQRMKRDWIHHGRRPSGVCGAAVILAARMNNYRRTLREVVLVAKVTEITVSKRLEEFKETASSNLSVNDFRDDNILGSISDMDPPAYYRSLLPTKPKAKGKRGRKRKGAPVTAAEIEGSDTESQAGESTADNENPDGQSPSKRPRIDADGFVVPEIPAHANRVTQTPQDNIDPTLRGESSDTQEVQPTRRGPGRLKGSKNWVAPPPTPEELAYEAELTSSMQEALDENPDLDSIRQQLTPPPTQPSVTSAAEVAEAHQQTPKSSSPLSSSSPSPPPSSTPPATELAIRVDPAECDPKKGPPGPAVNTTIGNTGTISLDPIISETEFEDDPEVSTCLLTEAERVLKEKIWVTENAEWLRQDHAKRIRRELRDRHLREQGIDPDEQRRLKKGEIKKRKDGARRSGRVGDVGYLKDDFHKKNIDDQAEVAGGDAVDTTGDNGRRPSTASLNVKAMMKQRGTYSRRINYDNLIKAYELPVGSSTSPSRSPSIDRDSREASVLSVSSTSSTIGPIFSGGRPRRMRGPKQTTTQPRSRVRDKEAGSPPRRSIEHEGTPNTERGESETETDLRHRSGSAASPEPRENSIQQGSIPRGEEESRVEVLDASSSASPLSSTYTPAGIGTPGSTGPTRIDRSMYSGLGAATITRPLQAKPPGANDNDEEDGNEEYDDNDDDDDDDDNDEDEDPDGDIEDAFAGNFQERPIWEGEDEIVEE